MDTFEKFLVFRLKSYLFRTAEMEVTTSKPTGLSIILQS